MKYLLIFLFLIAAVAGQAVETEPQASKVEPQVAQHYKQACLLRDRGEFLAAIEEAGKGIALNPLEREWLAKSELLSAELYVKVGMLEAADVTARQIEVLYFGTDFETKAKALREKIKQLTEQSAEAE